MWGYISCYLKKKQNQLRNVKKRKVRDDERCKSRIHRDIWGQLLLSSIVVIRWIWPQGKNLEQLFHFKNIPISIPSLPFFSSSCSGFNKAVILERVYVCVYPLSFDGGGYIKLFTCQLQTHNLTVVKFALELWVEGWISPQACSLFENSSCLPRQHNY